MSRRGRIRVNVAVQLLAAVISLIVVNVIGMEFGLRADFSRSQKFALSGQMKRLLRELKQPLEITVFFSRTTVSPVSALYGDVSNFLDELVFSGRSQVRVEFVDPVRDLSRAREIQAKYKFRADENVLVLDYGGRTAFLPVAEMADFDLAAVAGGGQPRVLAFKGEQAFAGALVSLVTPASRKVCFLQGHGEPPLGEGSPVSAFRDYIVRQNVPVEPLSLAGLDAVPADCEAVFVIGPQVDIPERELAILDAFWKAEGKLLVLLDPAAGTPQLDRLLASIGLRPRGDRVLRTVRLGFATGILREVTAEFLSTHPVTRRLTGVTLFLPGATESIAIEPASTESRVKLSPMLQPIEEFWGEVDHVTDAERGVVYDDGRDAGQPLYVAASAARGGTDDGRVQVESGKLIVVGNSEFALDAALSSQGLDFLVSATHWLLDRGQLTGIAPKVNRYFPLNLSDRQLGDLSLFSLILMPACAALTAFLVWMRRRS